MCACIYKYRYNVYLIHFKTWIVLDMVLPSYLPMLLAPLRMSSLALQPFMCCQVDMGVSSSSWGYPFIAGWFFE